MYKIKQIPEDFIVEEIINLDVKQSGEYSYFKLKKRDYTTLKAIQTIADKLNIPVKFISFAGNKDKKAVTEQAISIRGSNKNNIENLKLNDIELGFLGHGSEPISLGSLEGNEFTIMVKDLSEDEIKLFEKNIKNLDKIPNYFGEQRFSKDNAEIGRNMIKKRFKEAVNLIIKGNNDLVKDHIETNPTDYIGALRKINKKILKLYIHAYQSLLSNRLVYTLKSKGKNIKIPIVGFGTE